MSHDYYLAIDQARQIELKNSSRRWTGPFPFDDNAYFVICNRATRKRIAEGLNFCQAQSLLEAIEIGIKEGR